MLAENSERQKVMLVLKKENKMLLQYMAKRDNRNMSRQVDYLIELYRDQAEQQVIDLLNESENAISNGAKYVTGADVENALGIVK